MKKFIILTLATTLAVTGCAQKKDKVEPVTNSITQSEKVEELETDVLVIGAGGAGMTAAIEAYDQGSKVIIVEKMPFSGGNSVRAKGGLNAAETSTQKEMGIDDSIEAFFNDTYKGGKELNDKEVLTYFTENSAEAVEWLKSVGMNLDDVAPGAGASNPRMHRPAGGIDVGPALVETLSKNIKDRDIETLYNAQATKLIVENDTITGVLVKDVNTGEEQKILADSVIIATGGFGANEEMYTKYRKDLKGFITTNHSGATGDGITIAEEIGAALVDMEQIQTNPTVEQGTAEVISESIRGLGAIFVNKSGVRFTNEMLTRDVLSSNILSEDGKFAYIIFDQSIRDNMKAVEGMIKKGIVTEGSSIDELANKLEIDSNTLISSLDTWNGFVKNKKDDEFQRDTGMDNTLEKAPYYAIKVGPGVHHTMGGIKINSNAEVVKMDGNIIKGLYAAGETTGGVHGANRLGGNAVADITIFGRQAGQQAGKYSLTNGSLQAKTSSKKNPSEKLSGIKEGAKAQFKDGIYEGEAKGNNGTVKAKIIVENGFIQSIEILEHSETGPIFETVENQLIPTIIYNQDLEADTITGATVSSKAVLEILNNSVEK